MISGQADVCHVQELLALNEKFVLGSIADVVGIVLIEKAQSGPFLTALPRSYTLVRC